MSWALGPWWEHVWSWEKPKNKDKDLSPWSDPKVEVPDKFDPKDPKNKDSGLVWHYGGKAPKGAKRDWLFGRSISGCAVHDGLLYAAEWEGLLHCLDARTGRHHSEEDLGPNVWASPLWVEGKVFLPDDAGNVHLFAHGKKKEIVATRDMDEGMQGPPAVVDGVLYVATKSKLYAIGMK